MTKHWTHYAKGRRRAGVMNKLEEAYAAFLELRRRAGEVQWFKFEALTLKLADDCRYTPDFLVMLADGTLECHECKGFWADDAKVKIRCAAELFPFRFVAMTKADKRGLSWDETEY